MNSTTTSFGDIYCENNNTIAYDNSAYNYYHESNSGMDQDIQEDCDMEDDYYGSYDAQMADIVAEADYQDYYYDYQPHQAHEEYIEEDEYDYYDNDSQGYYQPEKTDYDYRTDSLLSLVVGVQSYLSEQANSSNASKCDSPLYSLQYKMYTYMRQRALELGVQF